MDYGEKMLVLEKKMQSNLEKLQTAKARVSALETDRQRLELSRKELMLNDYLPIIEALNMTPSELKELLGDYINTGKNTIESEAIVDEEY